LKVWVAGLLVVKPSVDVTGGSDGVTEVGTIEGPEDESPLECEVGEDAADVDNVASMEVDIGGTLIICIVMV
jgi:hypothetical protein